MVWGECWIKKNANKLPLIYYIDHAAQHLMCLSRLTALRLTAKVRTFDCSPNYHFNTLNVFHFERTSPVETKLGRAELGD